MLDFRDLECVSALCEELNFRRAAERLHLAQPALTKRIQKIERELGVTLFTRGSGGVSATAEALQLLSHVDSTLAHWRTLRIAAEQVREGTRGIVRIGAVGSAFYEALPRLLGPVRAAFPDISLRVDEMETPQLVEALHAGDIQLGFARPPVVRSLDLQTVWVEPLVAAIPATLELAERTSVSILDLADYDFVMFHRSSGTGYWDQVADLFRAAGVEFLPHENADHVTTMLGQVALGAGVSIVPASARRVSIPGVSYVELSEDAELPLAVAAYRAALPLPSRRVLDLLPPIPARP